MSMIIVRCQSSTSSPMRSPRQRRLVSTPRYPTSIWSVEAPANTHPSFFLSIFIHSALICHTRLLPGPHSVNAHLPHKSSFRTSFSQRSFATQEYFQALIHWGLICHTRVLPGPHSVNAHLPHKTTSRPSFSQRSFATQEYFQALIQSTVIIQSELSHPSSYRGQWLSGVW